jgi:biotin transport system substrate-specific component
MIPYLERNQEIKNMPLPRSVSLEATNFNVYARDGIKVFAVSLFIAVCAQIAIPLFFSPVPFTFQPFAIAMTGWMLGGKRGVLAVLAYLAEGAMGLPVFAHGNSGLTELFGPPGGYLFSYIPAVFIAGYFTKGSTHIGRLAFGFFLCNVAIYAGGLPWLSLFVGKDQVLSYGFYPFVIGDLLKIGLAISCVKMWEANVRQK